MPLNHKPVSPRQLRHLTPQLLLGALSIALIVVGCHTLAPTATPTAQPIIAPTITPVPTETTVPSPTATLAPGETPASPTPRPTRTPRPPRPITKIGPEIYFGTHTRLGKPRVAKLRDVSKEYVAEVRQEVGPDCLIVIRYQFDEPNMDVDPRQSAREWYERRRGDMLAMKATGAPNVAFETGVNECPDDRLDWYVQFSLELIPRMHADGLRCVAGNPSMGTWNEKNWPKFAPVIAILKPDDLIGLHEYWADEAQIDDRWYCGRWSIPEIAAVLGNTKIVITECGRAAGWMTAENGDDFLWELEKYDQVLAQYPNVVGAAAFTIDANWGAFNLFDLWPKVVFRYSLTPTPQP